MAKGGKKKRRAAGRARETFRAKQWYTIRSPRLFGGKPIGETLADEPEKLSGRTAEVTLQDLTGDFSKSHVKVKFEVAGVRGTEVNTKFIGHQLTSDYLRRLTRRKQSKVDDTVDVQTQDGYVMRVKPTIITERRCQASQKKAIREIARRNIEEAADGHRMSELVKGVVGGDLASNIYQEARKIYPIKRVEIRRSEVVAEPEEVDLEEEVFPEKTLEEEEAERKAEEEAQAEAEAAEAEAAEEEASGELEAVAEEAAEEAVEAAETEEPEGEAEEAAAEEAEDETAEAITEALNEGPDAEPEGTELEPEGPAASTEGEAEGEAGEELDEEIEPDEVAEEAAEGSDEAEPEEGGEEAAEPELAEEEREKDDS